MCKATGPSPGLESQLNKLLASAPPAPGETAEMIVTHATRFMQLGLKYHSLASSLPTSCSSLLLDPLAQGGVTYPLYLELWQRAVRSRPCTG